MSPRPGNRSTQEPMALWPGGGFCVGTVLACVVCTILVFRATIDAFFVSDDFDILRAVTYEGPLGRWAHAGSDFFRPLATLGFYVDHKLFGLAPQGFHIVNLLFHAACSILLAMVARLWAIMAGASRRRAETAALAAGLLFAGLPTHIEPVAWISCRGDLIAALFSLVAILVCLYRLSGAGVWTLPTMGLATVLAMFAKESAITVPILLVGLTLVPGRRSSNGKNASISILAVVLLFAYILTRRLVIGHFIGGYGTSVHGHVDLEVIGKLFLYFPSRILTPALGVWELGSIVIPLNMLSLAVASIAAVLLLRFGHRRMPVATTILPVGMMLILLLPVTNLSVVATSSEGTRFLYLPSSMFVLALAMVLAISLERRWIILVSAALLVPGAWAGYSAAARWVEAGDLTRRTINALREAPPSERLWLLCVPDDIDGAYVFRTGIDSAHTLFNPESPVDRIVPVVRHSRFEGGSAARTARTADGRYVLHPRDGAVLKACRSQAHEYESRRLTIGDAEGGGVSIRIDRSYGDVVACLTDSTIRILDTGSADSR